MIKYHQQGTEWHNGAPQNAAPDADKSAGRNGTIAYQILNAHRAQSDDGIFHIRFDALVSHDITYVGIIQTARASGLKEFPIPYAMTNCHNSLCAVGGTINEDDHVFGLSAAKKYGGIYVPANQSVIHSYAREELAACGNMILGSDSHTRYGALGTMGVGEGGPELVKQLLKNTWDITPPEVVLCYMTGKPKKGIGPHDVAIALVKETFGKGLVKNKVLEFAGPGLEYLPYDFRSGIDVMTTETTCLSSIWRTDEKTQEYYDIHGRLDDYRQLDPGPEAYYSGMIVLDLSEIRPMIAMPFHPSNTYTIEELNQNLDDILDDVAKRAQVSFGGRIDYSLRDKVIDGRLYCDQGIIAGCAGGGFENICAAADILRGRSIGNQAFTLSVYPASMPIYMELIRNGAAADILETGAVLKTAFCGPCFGAGDTPSNGAFSIRHSTRNFPNREGSKIQNGQIASVALMDARSIAATAANKGFLTAATDLADIEYRNYVYHFDKTIYEKRVYDSKGEAHPEVEIQFGPNIKDWPKMEPLTDNIVLKIVSEIHDPVTTTDELIPSGETSSYRSNPLGLAEFTLSRKDPAYVGRAKEVRRIEELRVAKQCPMKAEHALRDEYKKATDQIKAHFPDFDGPHTAVGSTIYAVKPGDGSAREQAASCQKVLGGWANIAKSYATKRYRSNLINWGMLPFVYEQDELPFKNGDYLYIPGIRKAIIDKEDNITAYVVGDEMTPVTFHLGTLTDDERRILLAGCLINFYKES